MVEEEDSACKLDSDLCTVTVSCFHERTKCKNNKKSRTLKRHNKGGPLKRTIDFMWARKLRDGKEIMKIKRIFNFNFVINSDKMLLEIIFIFYDCIL